MGSELLADTVDEEFDTAAARAYVDVEVLTVLEQLTHLAQDAPARAFVKSLGTHVLQRGGTSRAAHRICVGQCTAPFERFEPYEADRLWILRRNSSGLAML